MHHSNKGKNKITFEVSQRIKTLKGELPKVPLFNPDGRSVVTVAKIRPISGKDLIAQGVFKLDNGAKVYENTNYRQSFREVQFVNHEVRLTEAYRNGGEVGLQQYIDGVKSFDEKMKAAESVSHDVPQPAEQPIEKELSKEELSEMMKDGVKQMPDTSEEAKVLAREAIKPEGE